MLWKDINRKHYWWYFACVQTQFKLCIVMGYIWHVDVLKKIVAEQRVCQQYAPFSFAAHLSIILVPMNILLPCSHAQQSSNLVHTLELHRQCFARGKFNEFRLQWAFKLVKEYITRRVQSYVLRDAHYVFFFTFTCLAVSASLKLLFLKPWK